MKQQNPWCVAVAAILLTVALAQANEKPKAKTGLAATPEDAVTLFGAAPNTRNWEDSLELMGEPVTVWKYLLPFLPYRERFDAALDKRFGKLRKKKPVAIDYTLQVIGKKALGEDKVQPTVWMTQKTVGEKDHISEETWTAVKARQGWKLVVPCAISFASPVLKKAPSGKLVKIQVNEPPDDALDPDRLESGKEYTREKLPRLLAGYRKVTNEVAGGKYTSRKLAEDAWDAAEASLFPKQPRPSFGKLLCDMVRLIFSGHSF